MKNIVVSGINLFEGGTLTVMKNCLSVLSKHYSEEYKIYALVHSKMLYLDSNIENVHFIEFPNSRKSYFYRLYYEYFYFNKLSKKLDTHTWISLHDITPNVKAKKRYVYCHNATPFFKPQLNDWIYGRSASLSSFFYSLFYRLNIKQNDGVIVQQKWMRDEFKKMFNIHNIIVAYPNIENNSDYLSASDDSQKSDTFEFIYPALPRSFKNFEIICEAVKKLPQPVKEKICIYLTIDQSLNKYAKYIYDKYSSEKSIVFLGMIPYEEVIYYYKKCDFLLFPSKLESWGLPISEFKLTGKPIILADLPYAHETLNTYEKAKFFDPYKSDELSNILHDIVRGKPIFKSHLFRSKGEVFKTWESLFNNILG